MTSPPRVVLFDVLSTLVDDPFYETVPAFFGMSLQELLGVKHRSAWIHFEDGSWDEATFLEHFFADGREFDHAGMKRAMFDHYRLLEGVEPILNELRARQVSMHLVSNYPMWYQAIEERVGLSRWAPWTFVSAEQGMRKPDLQVFRFVANAVGVDPGECLFVDDQPRNCEAAAKAGMVAHQFETHEALRIELTRHGLLEEIR